MKPFPPFACGPGFIPGVQLLSVGLILVFSSRLPAQTNSVELPAGSAKTESSVSAPPPSESKPEAKKENENVSAVNPSTGAVTFNGFSWNIGDLPALDLRYERFLMENQSMMKDEEEYYKKLQSLLVLLTGNPFGRFGPQAPSLQNYQLSFNALKEIEGRPDWRKYDGGISGQIATQIEALVIKIRDSRDTKGQASDFEAKKRSIESQLDFLKTTVDKDPKQAAFNAERKAQLIAEKMRLQVERAAYEAELAAKGLSRDSS